MDFVTKRPGAYVVCAVIIICSTLFGAHRSLENLVRKTESNFYEGVYVDSGDYTSKSIYSQLEMMSDASLGLITTCNRPGLEPEIQDMRVARETLLTAMNARDISDMYSAFESLNEAYITLHDAISSSDLFNDDAVSEYMTNFSGAQAVITASGYNAEVQKLKNGTLSDFPANIFHILVNVDPPETFG